MSISKCGNLFQGSCLDLFGAVIRPGTVKAIITDPNFLPWETLEHEKRVSLWPRFWVEVKKALRPGGVIMARLRENFVETFFEGLPKGWKSEKWATWLTPDLSVPRWPIYVAAADKKSLPKSAGDVEGIFVDKNSIPVQLAYRMVDAVSAVGDLVVDPFMGKGSIGIACNGMGRGFVGFELDPVFYMKAVHALNQ